MLHPKYKRYFWQILAFGLIWLAFGLVYVLLEAGLLGSNSVYPSTGNQYDFQSSLIYTVSGSFITGLLQGLIEVTWLGRRFTRYPFWVKIILKSAFYLLFVVIFLTILTLVVNTYRLNRGLFDPVVLNSLWLFMQNFAFWTVVIYAGAILEVGLFYSEVSSYLGNGVIHNYAFGKYHRPQQETRIFMFLDMKSSTTIAEKIGHVKYFDLLKDYYADMTNAILETSGQIYQYVGDEIVVSWSKKEGVYDNNCIRCFSMISAAITKNKHRYLKRFGLVPEFKAGYHIGEVTTGEIGRIKKDIIYTGDVLNTTARIQAECNTYNAKALMSADLLQELNIEAPISYTKIGALALRGKTNLIQLYSIIF